MRQQFVLRSSVVLFAGLLIGCGGGTESRATEPSAPSDKTADFLRSLAGAPATFVLDHIEAQTTAPITTFDLVCQGQHYEQHV